MSVLSETSSFEFTGNIIHQNPIIIESLDPVIASIILLIVVLMSASSVAYRRVNTDPGWSIDDLESDEKSVVDLLENNKGRVEQKLISDEMKWSDAKTSRLTSSLIDKEVVEKVRENRQNYVILDNGARHEEDT